MPDFLPVCLQNFLHGREPELREDEITLSHIVCECWEWKSVKIRKRGRLGIRRMTGLLVRRNSQEKDRDTPIYQ